MIFREIYSNVFPVINSLALVVFSVLFNVQSRTRAPLFAQYFDFTNVYRVHSLSPARYHELLKEIHDPTPISSASCDINLPVSR